MPTRNEPIPNGIVDMETFNQLLEMDDDDRHEFSKGLVEQYINQATTTLKDMEKSVLGRSLISLSQQGHFLKGSSAALGLSKVKETCEKMQHAGLNKVPDNETKLSDDEALKTCKELLVQLKTQNAEAEKWLKDFYSPKNNTTVK